MSCHQVIIAGGGPTGLTLAAELALAGIDVAIVERRPSQALDGSRAGGLHPRTLELFDQRGIAERFVTEGQPHPVVLFAGAALDTGDLPSRFPYWLAIWQDKIERILAQWVDELSVPVYRDCEVTGFKQDAEGIDLHLAGGATLRASFLVGCDGGRSVVRKAAGISFPGWDASISYLIAEAETSEEPGWGVRYTEQGIQALARLDEGARVRMVLTESEIRQGEATEADVRAALHEVFGTDFGLHSVRWVSRFTDAARQAELYRSGRVLLAGDAAHIHSPAGGQGLNLGVQDAMNLGWKLALVVKGIAGETLLDTYHAERHPVGAEVLKYTLGNVALSRGDERTRALKDTLSHVMQMDAPRRWYSATLSGLNIRYDLGNHHPLVGRRVPDVDLRIDGRMVRLFTLLHEAVPVLLMRSAHSAELASVQSPPVKGLAADWDCVWTLPVLGDITAPEALLVRPDGYVVWAGHANDTTLASILRTAWG